MTTNSKSSGPSLIWTTREWYAPTFFFACSIIALISPMKSMRTFNGWSHDRVRRLFLLIERHASPTCDIFAGGATTRESTMNRTMDGDDRLQHSTASLMTAEKSDYGTRVDPDHRHSVSRDLHGRFRTMVQQHRKTIGSLNETDELLPFLDRKVTEHTEAEIFSFVIGNQTSTPQQTHACIS